MKTLHRYVWLALIAFSCHHVANADDLTLQPGPEGKDAQIADGIQSNLNFGNHVNLVINWSDNNRSVGLIEFDLSAISSSATINSATLRLFHEINSNSNIRYDVFRVTSAWDESSVTYLTAPTFDGNAIASLIIQDTGSGIFRSWNVTSQVQNWVNGTHANFGFWVEEVPIEGAGTIFFSSSDTSAPNQRPQLLVSFTAVPEPESVLLSGLVLVIGCMIFLRHRVQVRRMTHVAIEVSRQ